MARFKSRLNTSRFGSRFEPRHRSRFEVVISDYTSSIEEWRRAQKVSSKALPALTEEQKRAARKLGVTEEAYARSVLAGQYGAERMEERAVALGEMVGRMAGEIIADCKVASVVAEMFEGRWLVRLGTPAECFVVAIPRELADDVLDAGITVEVKKLRSLVKESLQRSEVPK